jgi:restriction system protein
MSTKEPELQDFGITPEEYALLSGKGGRDGPSCLVSLSALAFVLAVFMSVVFVITRDLGVTLAAGAIAVTLGFLPTGFVTFGVAILIESVLVRFKKSRLLESPVASRIKLYEEAEAAHRQAQWEAMWAQREAERQQRAAAMARREAERARQRRLQEYWMRLGGVEFERELATLYRHQGYRVESTPTSGDQGIDLILSKGGKTTVVQCKSHKSPVGPAVARELFGSMVAFPGADKAILACTGGFTQGVYEFVRDKPIDLISASHLAQMAESVKYETSDRTNEPTPQFQSQRQRQRASGRRSGAGRTTQPVCPMPGCRRKMISRTGRYGRFWGCPGYPRCKGTREIV